MTVKKTIDLLNIAEVTAGQKPEPKKQSLVELATSLGFKSVDENDPIYSDGWCIVCSVADELESSNKDK
jgi:hypothetical protein